MRNVGERGTQSHSRIVGSVEQAWKRGGQVMRELGRMFYKKKRQCHSFSVHECIRGNETEGVGTREAEMEDERLRLCHYDKQQEHSSA